MAFIDLKFYSETLGMQTEAYVLLPQKSAAGEIGTDGGRARTAYLCLYLLHGLSDDHTIWMRRTSIERYAAKYGVCVVMPCGHRSFYTDMKYGLNYYTYVAEELPLRIREFFPVSSRKEDNYVAGLSMGGYGALKIALREHDRFCAGAGLSSATDLNTRLGNAVSLPIFGDVDKVPPEDDLFLLAEKCAPASRPRLYMGVGMEDKLYGENLRFRDHLQKLGYDLTYRESHGTHNWAFWDEYIQYVLEWMFGEMKG